MTAPGLNAFRTICSADSITEGLVVPHYLDDVKRRIAIVRVDDRLYAFDDLCTCGGETCPLSGGLLEGTTIMCQCHGSRFDIATGNVVNGPAITALKLHALKEVKGVVQISL